MKQNIAINNAKKLSVELKKKRHPECGTTKIKGFLLSISDIDTCEMILNAIMVSGTYPINCIPLHGNLKVLFEKSAVPWKNTSYETY